MEDFLKLKGKFTQRYLSRKGVGGGNKSAKKFYLHKERTNLKKEICLVGHISFYVLRYR